MKYFLGSVVVLATAFRIHDSVAQGVRFDTFSAEEGLYATNILSIDQDGLGFLWLGTASGLVRWDGYETRVFRHDPDDSTSISNNYVHKVLATREGNVWIGTRDGLNYYDAVTETFRSFAFDSPTTEGAVDEGVSDIGMDADNVLWLGIGGGGLIRYDPSTEDYRRYRHDVQDPQSLPGDFVRVVHVDEHSGIWVGTAGNGIGRMDPDTERFTSYRHDPDDPSTLSGDVVMSIDEDTSGRLVIAIWRRGIDRFDPSGNGSFEHLGFRPSADYSTTWDELRTARVDRSGRVWAASASAGLNRNDFDDIQEGFRSSTWYRNDPRDPFSLGDTDILSIFQDRENIMWFGTWRSGLSRLDFETAKFGHIRSLMTDMGPILLPDVTAVYRSADDALWIGTWGTGLFRIDPNTGRAANWRHDAGDANSLPGDRIESILESSPGVLWIGSWEGGLARFDVAANRFERFENGGIDDPNSVPAGGINTMIRTSEGRILIGAGGGAAWLDPRTESFERLGGFTLDQINVAALLEDRSGAVWLGHGVYGLQRFDPVTREPKRFLHLADDTTTISSNIIRTLYQDAGGRIWVGTTEGLDLFDPDTHTFERFGVMDGLPHHDVLSIVEDDRGRLWLGTGGGLSVFDSGSATFRNFDVSDGLNGPAFSRAAVMRDSTGHLVFGGSGGLNRFHPDSLARESTAPVVAFTAFEVTGGERIPVTSRAAVQLSHTDRAFTVEFSALSFRNPTRNTYRYRLVGVSDEWTDLDTQHRLTLTGLSPGSYSLEVMGANSDGVWSEQPAILGLVVTPPWWNSRSAWFVYVLLIIAALGGIRRYETNRTRLKHELELEAAEREKLTELDRVKSRFLANLSHEFRTPLTMIIGPLREMMARRESGASDTRDGEAHAMMLRNAHRLQRLINQILDLSRLESGQMGFDPETHDLNAFVRSVAQTMAPLAEREKVALNGPEVDPLPAVFDSGHMEKVLGNLVSNALKFTDAGGRVDIHIRANDRTAEIAVRDSGIGIPADRLVHVFDRFVQVDSSPRRRHEGSGIGLSLALELMELHGGTIRAESIEGEGSTFTAILPLAAARADRSVPSAPAAPHVQGDLLSDAIGPSRGDGHPGHESAIDRTRILVVDDNADVRRFVRSLLEEAYEVFDAGDGKEGLERARSVLPDLIVADVMMPRLDGFELSRKLRMDPTLAGVPVILLTARAAIEDEVEGLGTGADHFVRKPFEPDVLRARVQNLLDGRRRLKSFYSGGADDAQTPELSAFASALVEVIDNHMTDSRFSVEMLAGEMALSPSQLRRRTKDELDASPNELIRERRLSRAADLLRDGAGTVSEIGFAVGFNSLHYFSRSYSARFGAPPSEHLGRSVRS